MGKSLHKRRYGGDWPRIFQEVIAASGLNDAAMHDLQACRLRQHMVRASKIPYWPTLFADFGINLKSDDIFTEYKKLPVLKKTVVQEYHNNFMNTHYTKQKLLFGRTSGSTGAGLVVPFVRSTEQQQWATWWRYRFWHGLDFDTWCGYFAGAAVPARQASQPYYRLNPFGRQVRFSVYHLTEATVKDYLAGIRKYHIQWLHGYPSQMTLLASLAKEQNLPTPQVRVITTGAEGLYSHQKKLLQHVFGAEVRQHYGLAEGVANISECTQGRLHVDEDFAFVEFLPVEGIDNQFRIIGANWSNPAFILLRYDSGDIATLAEDQRCPCGRTGRIVSEIDGRKEDYILLKDGVKASRFAHLFESMGNIREAQIYQPVQGELVFRIVKGSQYTKADEALLRQEILKRFGNRVDFGFQYVDKIERAKAGKLRMVISDAC